MLYEFSYTYLWKMFQIYQWNVEAYISLLPRLSWNIIWGGGLLQVDKFIVQIKKICVISVRRALDGMWWILIFLNSLNDWPPDKTLTLWTLIWTIIRTPFTNHFLENAALVTSEVQCWMWALWLSWFPLQILVSWGCQWRLKTEDCTTFFTILVANQHDAQENGNNL